MGLTHFPHGVSSFGMPVLPGMNKLFSGNPYWVDSNSNAAVKGGFDTPYRTINAAVGACLADRGDVIFVKEGHVEDLADTSSSGAIDLDVAGISVIGLGNGSLVPRIDMNHVDSDFIIGANDILVENIHLEATVADVKLGIAIEAGVTGTTIRNCKFTSETTTTDEFLITINLLAACHWTTVEGCHIDMGLGGAAVGIKLVGASTDVTIRNNIIKGDYSIANINGITTLSTEILIEENLLINGASGNVGIEPVIELITNSTGVVRRNTFFCNVATIAAQTVADKLIFSENYAGEDVGGAAGNILRTAALSVTASADD